MRPRTVIPRRTSTARHGATPANKKIAPRSTTTTTLGPSATAGQPKRDPFERKKKKNTYFPRHEGPVSDHEAALFYRPDFDITPQILNAVLAAVDEKLITAKELVGIYELAWLLAKAQGRRRNVQFIDIEAALEILSIERLEAVSNGTIKMGAAREVLPAPRNVHEIRWKTICTAALADYKATHKA